MGMTTTTNANALLSLANAARAIAAFSDRATGPKTPDGIELSEQEWEAAIASISAIAINSLSLLSDAGVDADLETTIEAIEDFTAEAGDADQEIAADAIDDLLPGPHRYRVNGEGFFTRDEIAADMFGPAIGRLDAWIENRAPGQLDLSDPGLPLILTRGGGL